MYHVWGDEDFDWEALWEACGYVSVNCKRWARFGVWTKEKYGTMRVHPWLCLVEPVQSLLYPGYCRYMLPRWFRKYVDWPLGKVLAFMRIDRIIMRYQLFILKFFWKRAAKKWPQVAGEILADLEFTFND